MKEKIEDLIKLEEKDIVDSPEGLEGAEHGFAKELKKPYKGSYLKKLQRIAGAFVLAGAVGGEAIAPELSQEFIESAKHKFVDDIKKEGKIEIYKKILISLNSEGGVPFSHDAPGKLFKTFYHYLEAEALQQARKSETPYFSKPEVILGKQFIKENPRLAERYMEKIKKTMEATVMIYKSDGDAATGVFTNIDGEKAILTNAHVAKNMDTKIIYMTSDGKIVLARPQFLAHDLDLAIIRPEKQDLGGARALNLVDSDQENLAEREKLVSVGNPLEFPFEVNISQFKEERFISLRKIKDIIETESGYFYLHTADARFAKLASYDFEGTKGDPIEKGLLPKGITLPGMSGSPLVSLDKDGEVKLIGLNAFWTLEEEGEDKNKKITLINITIPAKTIRAFLDNYRKEKAAGFPNKTY